MLENISLFDVLAAPTENKTSPSISQEPFNPSDFSERVEKALNEEIEEEIEVEDDYDAVHEATKLVNLFDVGNSLALTPLATWKLQKNRGGKSTLEKMKVAYMKRAQGGKLSEEDEKLCASFESYKADMMLLQGEIPYSKQQRDQLIKLGTSYCESTRMKTSDSLAFWVLLGGTEVSKITKILMM